MEQESAPKAWVYSPAVALGLCLVAADVRSQVPLGPKFQVNNYTTSNQGEPRVAADAAGNFVVVWQSAAQDGSGNGVFARMHDTAGAPLGSDEFRVNAFTQGAQYSPAVAVSPSGSFVVAWTSSGEDGSLSGVFGRRFDAAGVPGPAFAVNTYTTGSQYSPAAAMNAAGDFVVVWTSDDSVGGRGVFGRRFGADGTPAGVEFQIDSRTTASTRFPRVAMAEDGRFVVVWAAYDSVSTDVAGQRYDAEGARVGGEFRVNTFTTSLQHDPEIASDAAGNVVVVWSGFRDAFEGVFAQRYAPDGSPRGGEFRVNETTTAPRNRPAVALDADGNFIVVWVTVGSHGSNQGAFGRRFDAAGLAEGADFRLNAATTAQLAPSVSADEGGDFVTVWAETGATGSEIVAQRFRPDVIFKDDFETAGLDAWSAGATDGGDLAPSIFAAMDSTSVGLRGVVDDTAALYVQDDSPRDERRYRARFWFDPNGFDPGEAQQRFRTRVFIAFSEAPVRRVAAVVLRRQGGVYSLRGRARLDDNSQHDTPFVPLTDGPHAIEIDLRAAGSSDIPDGHFELWVDGVAVGVETGLDNSLAAVDFARMGALSLKPGANGTLHWDQFESRRIGSIGP